MNSTKKLALALIMLIAASAFTVTALVKEKNPAGGNNSQSAKLVLYYGNNCPHCKIVEDYIQTNDLAQKLGIAQKEVWYDLANQNEFVERARICGLDLNNLGVPMLFDAKNSKCYEGDQPIIDFLNQLKQ